MIKIAICDDKENTRKEWKELLNQCLSELEEKEEIEVFSFRKELLEEMADLAVLFLNIGMPEMDGIETGRKVHIKNKDCKIIVATSRQECFKEAFKINAFRFVTKPFQKAEIKEALKDVFRSQIGTGKLELYRDRIKHTFLQKDILYMSAIDSSVEFFLKEGIFRKETSLQDLEEVLDDRLFYRVNKQCIVNMQYVNEYKNGVIEIGKTEIRVSVRKKKDFEKVYSIIDVNER